MRQYRQGDVFIEEVDKYPPGMKRIKIKKDDDVILAWGEVTGHAHRIFRSNSVSYFSCRDDHNVIVVRDAPVALRHEEHRTIEIPPGTYIVRRQREYVPGEVPRVVAD